MVPAGPGFQIGVIVLSVVGLWIGARLLIDAVVRLARRFGLSELTIGLTVVAMGTSMPELAVSVDAAFKGLGDIAVANVLGSNIYNLAFILGIISLVKLIPIAQSLVHRDGIALLASTLIGGLALLDLRISRLEGVFLAGSFAAYTAYLLQTAQTPAGGSQPATADSHPPAADSQPATADAIIRPVTDRVAFRGRDALFLLGGLALILISGDVMIMAASALARGVGISEWVIGGTIVAAGTSTPEFAVSLVAIRRGSLGVSVGNIIGSNIYNITGILGVAAVVQPLVTSGAALETLAWLAGISILMVAALWTKQALSRLEGALFAISEVLRWVLGILGW